jgi:hypothetical protein
MLETFIQVLQKNHITAKAPMFVKSFFLESRKHKFVHITPEPEYNVLFFGEIEKSSPKKQGNSTPIFGVTEYFWELKKSQMQKQNPAL